MRVPDEWTTGEWRNNCRMKEWTKQVNDSARFYYLNYEGAFFHDWSDLSRAERISKVAYGIFGPPTTAADSIAEAYEPKQRETAGAIYDKILERWMKVPKSSLKVNVVFVHGIWYDDDKKDALESQFPVFRVLEEEINNEYKAFFVDHVGRIYETWDDWEKSNTLPPMKYGYPSKGRYSTELNCYRFDRNERPYVTFGQSPSSTGTSKFLKVADTTATVGGLLSGVMIIGSMFFPPLAPVVAVAAVTGTVAGLYGGTRAIVRLADKGQHGESMVDLEAWTLYLSIVAMPLHVGMSATASKLATGAAQGRIFSENARLMATLLSVTTLGVDSALFTLSTVSLIERAKNKELTTLDFLQWSMSVFFFANTIVQPKTASGIIKQAQQAHIQTHAEQMTDGAAAKSFQEFLQRNGGDMNKDSHIIRTLNRIEDPQALFKNNAGVNLGGRKGKTVMVDPTGSGKYSRVNPNRVKYTDAVQDARNIPAARLARFSGQGDRQRREDIEFNDERTFENLTNEQKVRANNSFGRTAKYDNKLIATALKVATDMGVSGVDGICSIIEIVATYVNGSTNRSDRIGTIVGSGRANFVSDILSDLQKATAIASKSNLNFTDPLKAVYHYRKHGADFPQKIHGPNIEFYLGDVPKTFTENATLVKVHSHLDSNKRVVAVKKTYVKPNSQMMMVTIECEGQHTISTMYRDPGLYAECQKYFTSGQVHQSSGDIFSLGYREALGMLNTARGFRHSASVKGADSGDAEAQNADLQRAFAAFFFEWAQREGEITPPEEREGEMESAEEREEERELTEEQGRSAPIQNIGSLPDRDPLQTAMLITITNCTTTIMSLQNQRGDFDVAAQSVPGRHAMRCGCTHSSSSTYSLALRFAWNSLSIRLFFGSTGGLCALIGNMVRCTVSENGNTLATGDVTNGSGTSLRAGGLKISWTCSGDKEAVIDVEVEEDDG